MPEEVQTEEALTLPSDIPHELILMAILNLELNASASHESLVCPGSHQLKDYIYILQEERAALQ